MTARVLLDNSWAIDWNLIPRALLGVLALLCGNGYIVGINQIYDVKIDKISKPFLPIAAGKLTPMQVRLDSASFLLCSLAGSAIVIPQKSTLRPKWALGCTDFLSPPPQHRRGSPASSWPWAASGSCSPTLAR